MSIYSYNFQFPKCVEPYEKNTGEEICYTAYEKPQYVLDMEYISYY